MRSDKESWLSLLTFLATAPFMSMFGGWFLFKMFSLALDKKGSKEEESLSVFSHIPWTV